MLKKVSVYSMILTDTLGLQEINQAHNNYEPGAYVASVTPGSQ